MRDPPGDARMIDPVSVGATASAGSHLQLVPQPSSRSADTSPSTTDGGAAPASAQPGARIYVERGDDGLYVYRLVDVATGRVLAELPRGASQSLKVLDAYTPGAVTSASA